MYDKEHGEAEWSTSFPDNLPDEIYEDPAQFQVFLSDISVDSLLGSYLEVGAP